MQIRVVCLIWMSAFGRVPKGFGAQAETSKSLSLADYLMIIFEFEMEEHSRSH